MARPPIIQDTSDAASRRRRRVVRLLALALLGIVILGGLGYRWLIDPHRLRSLVLLAIESVGIPSPSVGTVEFVFPNEILLTHLELSAVDAHHFGLPIEYAKTRITTRLEGARLTFSWSDLAGGRVWPREVKIDSALARIERCDTARAGEAAPEPPPITDSPAAPPATPLRLSFPFESLPKILVNDIEVQFTRTEPAQSRLVSRWRGCVVGDTPPADSADNSPRYEFRVIDRKTMGDGDSTQRFSIRWLRGGFDLSLTTVKLDTVAFLMPDSLADELRKYDLHGALTIEKAGVRGTRLEFVAANLRDVEFCLPLELDTPRAERLLPITNLRVDATLNASAGWTAVLQLSGRARGAPLHGEIRVEPARAETDTVEAGSNQAYRYTVHLAVDDIVMPPHTEYWHLLEHKQVPRGLRYFIYDYDPSGNFGLRFAARGAARFDGSDVRLAELDHYEAIVEPRGARAVYAEFPYPLIDITGALRIVNGAFELDGITGMHGGARIRIDGNVDHSGPWTGLQLRIRGDQLAMNRDLYEALPRGYRNLWMGTSPIGIADVYATVSREDGQEENQPQPLHVHIETRWLNASFDAEQDMRLTDADALITIGDHLEIHDLHGYADTAAIRVQGGVDSGSRGGRDAAQLRIEAHDISLQRKASLHSPQATDAHDCDTIAFQGIADVWGTSTNREAGSSSERYVARIKDGAIFGRATECTWRELQGWVTSSAAGLGILELTADSHSTRLHGQGEFQNSGGDSRLSFFCIDENLTDFLACAAPDALHPLVDTLGISGPGAITLGWQQTANSNTLDLHLECASAAPAALPVIFHELRGQVHFENEQMELLDLVARVDQHGSLVLQGGGAWRDQQPNLLLYIGATDLPINERVWSWLTGDQLGTGDPAVSPRGTADATLTAHWSDVWRVNGSVDLRDFRGELGLLLEHCDGIVRGSVAIPQVGTAELDLGFEIAVGKLAGRVISDLSGHISTSGDRTKFRLRDVRGTICGGVLLASLDYDPRMQMYELSLNLRSVNSDEIQMRPFSPGNRGRLDATLTLRGRSGDDGTRTGTGELRIYDTSFVRVPVLADLLETLRLRNNVDETLDFAELQFICEGRVLRLTNVEIHGRDVRLVGEGLWNVTTDRIELNLVGANPRNWPRVAVLSDVVELAGSELMQYRVSGTSSKPVITPEPLHRLTEPIRRLIARSRP